VAAAREAEPNTIGALHDNGRCCYGPAVSPLVRGARPLECADTDERLVERFEVGNARGCFLAETAPKKGRSAA
jgi:hypothetical protein